MKVINDILIKLFSSILVAILLMLGSYSFFTGEFPPKIAHLKKGFATLQAQLNLVRKLQEEKLKNISQNLGSEELIGSTAESSDKITNDSKIKLEPFDEEKILSATELEYRIKRAVSPLEQKISDLELRILKLEAEKIR